MAPHRLLLLATQSPQACDKQNYLLAMPTQLSSSAAIFPTSTWSEGILKRVPHSEVSQSATDCNQYSIPNRYNFSEFYNTTKDNTDYIEFGIYVSAIHVWWDELIYGLCWHIRFSHFAGIKKKIVLNSNQIIKLYSFIEEL